MQWRGGYCAERLTSGWHWFRSVRQRTAIGLPLRFALAFA
jgi:hypothetical protein